MDDDFILEEIYEAWSEAVMDAMMERYRIPRSIAQRIMLMYVTKKEFVKNSERFEFIPVDRVARYAYVRIRGIDTNEV